jgi:hypothetical protein
VRASHSAGLAHGAKPEGPGFKHGFLLAKLDGAHELIGGKVEMLGCGATGRALLALVTEESVFVTLPANLIGQIGTYCFIHRQLLFTKGRKKNTLFCILYSAF